MSKEPIGDVWTLETPSEELASEDLGAIVSLALEKRSTWARNYLRKLWDNESWSSIKEKLLTEGSTWYVWWMDGVRQHAVNMAAERQAPSEKPKQPKRKPRAKKSTPRAGVRGIRR